VVHRAIVLIASVPLQSHPGGAMVRHIFAGAGTDEPRSRNLRRRLNLRCQR
jgi:hypothetical protein